MGSVASVDRVPPGPVTGAWPIDREVLSGLPTVAISSSVQQVPSTSAQRAPASSATRGAVRAGTQGRYTRRRPLSWAVNRYPTTPAGSGGRWAAYRGSLVEPVGTARTAITSSRGTSTPRVSSRRSTGWYAASRSSSGAAARSTAAVAYTASPSPSRSDSSPVAWSSSASVSRTAAIGLRRAAWLGGRPALRTPLCGTATSTADRPVVNTVDSEAAGPSRASWLP